MKWHPPQSLHHSLQTPIQNILKYSEPLLRNPEPLPKNPELLKTSKSQSNPKSKHHMSPLATLEFMKNLKNLDPLWFIGKSMGMLLESCLTVVVALMCFPQTSHKKTASHVIPATQSL